MKRNVTIKSNREFQRMYRRATSVVTPTIVVYYQRNKLNKTRIGITTGLKLGHAVVRNRLRRQVREIFRLNKSKIEFSSDLVVVVRNKAIALGYHSMERDFLKAVDIINGKKA